MRPVSRRLKRHFGATAKQVSVRSRRPWYWKLLTAAVLFLFGYLLAYWQTAGGEFGKLNKSLENILEENRAMQARLVHGERQLQVERAAQANLSKELAKLQDEDMRLKQDVAFYKNILTENVGTSQVKLHSFELTKGQQPNQYEYHLLIVQSGRHDKTIQGNIKLMLSGIQSGKPVSLPVTLDSTAAQAMKINFKYYQRIDGMFLVPAGMLAQAVEASFIEIGGNRPKISLRADLPA